MTLKTALHHYHQQLRSPDTYVPGNAAHMAQIKKAFLQGKGVIKRVCSDK